MPYSQTITWMIICCILFASLLCVHKPLKTLLMITVNAALGGFGIIVCNALLAPVGAGVGLNALTLLVVGVLGLPGFVTLYISSAML